MNYRTVALSVIVGMVLVGVHSAAPLQSLAAELEDIRERGYLIVGVQDDVRPLSYQNEVGQLEGLEIDVARQLAEELLGANGQIVFQPVNNEERISVLLSGDVDLVIARITATASRSRLVDFSPPYYMDGTAVVTKHASVQTVSDLSNGAIAVLNGSTTINDLRFLIPHINLIGVNSYQEALNLLESDQAVAFAADASVLTGWVHEYPAYRLLPTLLSADPLSVAMPKGLQYGDLRQRINEAITQWRDEGWLQERIEYWGLPE
ncbi:MAG: transporter substrate-binding domain-containing protein [Elainellaceae cyanobacterium]